LARRLDGLQIQEIVADPTQPDLPHWLIEVVQPETDVVFVSNLEPAIPAVLTYLNYRRETLLWLSRPVVMWASEWAVQEMIRHAPDFWAFRRHLFEFIPARAALERLAVQMLEGTDWVYASVDELADRIALHQALIADMEAKGIGKSALTAGLRRDLGVLQQRIGQWSEAKATLAEALAIFRDLGDRAGEAQSLHQMGIVAQSRGEYDAALSYYRRSLEIAEQLGDRAGVASSLHQIGNVHYMRGDYPAALEHYRRSLEMAEQLGDRAGVAISQAQMALLLEQLGQVGEALLLIRQAEAEFIRLGSPMAIQARQVRERLEREAEDTSS
jgi:tetratricopeptide (TPR) repeat protein